MKITVAVSVVDMAQRDHQEFTVWSSMKSCSTGLMIWENGYRNSKGGTNTFFFSRSCPISCVYTNILFCFGHHMRHGPVEKLFCEFWNPWLGVHEESKAEEAQTVEARI